MGGWLKDSIEETSNHSTAGMRDSKSCNNDDFNLFGQWEEEGSPIAPLVLK